MKRYRLVKQYNPYLGTESWYVEERWGFWWDRIAPGPPYDESTALALYKRLITQGDRPTITVIEGST